MTKSPTLPINRNESAVAIEHLKLSYFHFDVASGKITIPRDFDQITSIPNIVRISRQLTAGRQALFELSKSSTHGYSIVATGVMREILAMKNWLIEIQPMTSKGINLEAAIFIDKIQSIAWNATGLFFGIDADQAIRVRDWLNNEVNEFRKETNSAEWKKRVRSFYKRITKNFDSIRDYLLDLTSRHKHLQCVRFDFSTQKVDKVNFFPPNDDVVSEKIEEWRSKVIRFIKTSAPSGCFVGYVWKINTSMYQGCRLSIIAFYKSGLNAELEDHKAMVKNHWENSIVTASGGRCFIDLKYKTDPVFLVFRSKERRQSIETIAIAMAKTQIFVRPRSCSRKTVGHGQLS
ncbi:MAG: hypothetical protein RBS14_02780 [Atribacterota bacterium]|jgi:hypothetical protein|nr:hypothetical protein [Atribacterota bacterium]